VAAQRGHSTPEAPHTAYASGWPQGTGAWRNFHENKTARLPYMDPSTDYNARTLHHLHLQAPDAHGGEQRKPEHSRISLGRREWAARGSAAGGHRPFGGRRPPPPSGPERSLVSPGCGRAAGAPQRERFFARGERAATTQP
jgi:hypothetical protein